jgi:ferritin-like metal-binding protein YciE
MEGVPLHRSRCNGSGNSALLPWLSDGDEIMPNTTSESESDRPSSDTQGTGKNEAAAVFITGLKNAHAMETQALSIMRPQLERIENYPEIAQRLQQHIAETEDQVQRLEQVLDAHREDKSGLKDMAMSIAGGMAAIGHSLAGDEILKDCFANYAFEHYEIAAYKSLVALARAAGATASIPLLQQNLDQELAMAEWLDQNVEPVTMKYLSLRAAEDTAKR